MNNATEQLINEVVGFISKIVPIEIERTKNKMRNKEEEKCGLYMTMKKVY